jgi:lipoyl(octanoyl) transferase
MKLIIRDLGITPYQSVWEEMKRFTKERNKESDDELWLVEHPSVYTLGLAGRQEHLLHNPQNIPLIRTDRGGQITYHGPGQLVIYPLLNLHRLKLNIRSLVCKLEGTVIRWLKTYQIEAKHQKDAPGVYIQEKKIASIGIKVSRGFTYHGIAINLNMNLTPFNGINPCGFEKLKMCQLKDFVNPKPFPTLKNELIEQFNLEFGSVYQMETFPTTCEDKQYVE